MKLPLAPCDGVDMSVSRLGRDVQLGAGRVHELQSVDRTAGGQARGHRAGVPAVREVRTVQCSAVQCRQEEKKKNDVLKKMGSSLKGAQRTEMEDDYSFSTQLM